MKVKTFKRMSKRFISSLLSVLMILSLFTVCMVGTTTSVSANWTATNKKVTVDISSTGWSSVYLYIGNTDYISVLEMTKNTDGTYSCTVNWNEYDSYFFADKSYDTADSNKVYNTYQNIPATSRSLNGTNQGVFQNELPGGNIIIKTLNTKMTADISKTGWSQVYLYVGNSSSVTKYNMTQDGTKYTAKVTTTGYSGYFFSYQDLSLIHI